MEDPFFITVPRALTLLYCEGKAGHWADVRTTSEAILALLASGENMQSQHLRYAGDFLVGSFKPEECGGSWGSELWDTALAVRALHKLAPKGHDIVESAFHWMYTKQLADGSFDGEPWDSLFVCLAALETGRFNRVAKTIDWLVSLQTPQGVVISKQYSGLFCQVLAMAVELGMPGALHHKLHEATARALQFLWDEYCPETLWGSGSWINAYVICGMLALKHSPLLNEHDHILRWYMHQQAENGAWDDTVRTAIVLQALLELRLKHDIEQSSKDRVKWSADVVANAARTRLFGAIDSRTQKAAVVRARKLLDRDEDHNRIITLTPERQTYLTIIAFALGLAWAIATNWGFVHRVLSR